MSGSFRKMVPVLIALMTLTGCGKTEEPAKPVSAPQKRQTRVVIPEEVQGKWKAVKIAVFDKETSKQEVYTVDLGYEFVIPGSRVAIRAQNFLPAFIMDEMELTSVSNETRNPAVQVVIREGDRELFQGWLFSLYPGAHNFQHPRFNFTLVDFIPATKKS